jgi:hypothetical protein
MSHQILTRRQVSVAVSLRQRLLAIIPVVVAVALIIVQFSAAQEHTQPQTSGQKEIWAENRIAGVQAGNYHEAETRDSTGQIVTSITNEIVLNRMGSKVELKSTSLYREADVRLLSIHSVMSSSAQSTITDATVHGNTLVIHISTGGKTYDRTLPFTGELLGPAAARRLTIFRLKSPGDVVSYQMFVPELGTVTTITDTLIGNDTVTVEGAPQQALKLEQTNSAMPGKSALWLDADGFTLRQLTPSPFGDVETIRASAQDAQSDTKGATLPQESFAGTLVSSNVRLPEERLIEQLTIRITHKKPELGWPDFSADNQRVLEKTPDHVVLEIRRVSPKEDGQRPAATTDPKLQPYLEPNALLQSDDPAVRSIAAKVVGGETDAFRAARDLQEWTNENMKFDLGIAVAPASEVARNRRGTCFGYAVLLASLARAEGIPSRIRMGFVYAGGIWGGHAWVEVLAGDQWIPLDAALYSPGPADAARFSFLTSSFQEGTIAQVGELAKLYGNVEVQVLDYTIDGRKVIVPQDARPFTISGDTYQNPWLGLTVKKPKEFRFTELDAVWPNSTVVAMEGPGQQVVDIQSRSATLPVDEGLGTEELLHDADITGKRSEREVAGHRVTLISSADSAGLVLKRGGNLFVIKAKGPNAVQLLLQVASSVRLGN